MAHNYGQIIVNNEVAYYYKDLRVMSGVLNAEYHEYECVCMHRNDNETEQKISSSGTSARRGDRERIWRSAFLHSDTPL